MFVIDFDEARHLLRVIGTGTVGPVALAQFALDMRRVEIHKLVGRQELRFLGDGRDMTVQPQAVADLCRLILARLLEKRGFKAAVIASSMLLKLQLDRTFAGMAVGIFSSEEEALAYLGVSDRADQHAA